jgi:hypothetical protein
MQEGDGFYGSTSHAWHLGAWHLGTCCDRTNKSPQQKFSNSCDVVPTRGASRTRFKVSVYSCVNTRCLGRIQLGCLTRG